MRSNPKYDQKVFLFMQGKLPVDQEEDLFQKIKTDEAFRELFLRQQKELQQKVIQSEDPGVDAQWNRFKLKVSQRQAEQRGSSKNIFHRKFLSIAAAFVLGLLISSVIYFARFEYLENDQQVQEISIPYGGKSKFTLPDGSVVWLNSGSKLSYPTNFKGQRSIQLEGEAYFDVVKNRNPFVVSTLYGNVKVLGTSFNVKAYTDDDFETTLVEGTVDIKVDADNHIILKPGQQAFINENDRLEMQPVETEIFTSWKDGKLIFYREPFEKVAKRMERWYNVNIQIDNDEIKDLWFTGTIEMETLSEVMELISHSMSVKYTYDQRTRTLRIEKN